MDHRGSGCNSVVLLKATAFVLHQEWEWEQFELGCPLGAQTVDSLLVSTLSQSYGRDGSCVEVEVEVVRNEP